jgi:two-component system, cell cycle sensor histidine kinase and response regulator CckA
MRRHFSLKTILTFNFILVGALPILLVAVAQSDKELSSFSDRIRDVPWVGLGFSLVLALGMTMLSIRKIMRPLPRLISDSRKIAEGDYPLEVHPATYPEIGPLFGELRMAAEAVKAREDALREREETYRVQFENINDVIYSVDRDLKIIGVSPSVEKVLGYRPEDMIGKTLSDLNLLTPESLQDAILDIGRGFAGEPLGIGEYGFVAADGTRRLGELRSAPIRSRKGDVIGLIGVGRDITEREEAISALRESEERYRLVIENANDAIFIAQDGVIKFPNPRTLELLEYSPAQLLEIPFANHVHPDDRQMLGERHLKRLKGETVPTPYPFRAITRDGRQLWVEISPVKIAWEGRPATLNFARDITFQRKLEAQLQQAQKMEAVGTLAGGIAHDFNNLLMGIQGNVSLMLWDLERSHPFYQRLENIQKQVQSGSKLTNQLLGYARKGRYEVRPLDLNQVVCDTSETFGRTRREVRIKTELAAELYPVVADQVQIEQVLLNLFINASDAMPGGGDLVLRTTNVTHLNMGGRPYDPKPGNYALLEVIDNGIGMDKATMERVFEPFFTTKEMGRGTGLGLASAYGIIKGHGGYIEVDSQKGKGTTFSVYLPASEVMAEGAAETLKTALTGKGTILLVDDDVTVLEVGGMMLQRLGYEVIEARSGEEAVTFYKGKQPAIDLVILDMIMPELGGGPTFDELKQINPEVKVLLSSGYSREGQANEIMARGCHGFIQKPFSMEELSQKIMEITGS